MLCILKFVVIFKLIIAADPDPICMHNGEVLPVAECSTMPCTTCSCPTPMPTLLSVYPTAPMPLVLPPTPVPTFPIAPPTESATTTMAGGNRRRRVATTTPPNTENSLYSKRNIDSILCCGCIGVAYPEADNYTCCAQGFFFDNRTVCNYPCQCYCNADGYFEVQQWLGGKMGAGSGAPSSSPTESPTAPSPPPPPPSSISSTTVVTTTTDSIHSSTTTLVNEEKAAAAKTAASASTILVAVVAGAALCCCLVLVAVAFLLRRRKHQKKGVQGNHLPSLSRSNTFSGQRRRGALSRSASRSRVGLGSGSGGGGVAASPRRSRSTTSSNGSNGDATSTYSVLPQPLASTSHSITPSTFYSMTSPMITLMQQQQYGLPPLNPTASPPPSSHYDSAYVAPTHHSSIQLQRYVQAPSPPVSQYDDVSHAFSE